MGFGFGDAMFAVKDLTDNYDNYNGPSPAYEPPVQKNPIAKPPSTAPRKGVPIGGGRAPVKPEPKGTKVTQIHPPNLPKEPFKVSAGKEFANIKTSDLFQVPSTTGVYELSLKHTVSHWEYNVFCDGVPAS